MTFSRRQRHDEERLHFTGAAPRSEGMERRRFSIITTCRRMRPCKSGCRPDAEWITFLVESIYRWRMIHAQFVIPQHAKDGTVGVNHFADTVQHFAG